MNPLRMKVWSPYYLVGARIAQGCTSLHAISGILQLALSNWIFAPVIGVAGMITAFLIYGKEGQRHVC